MDAQMKCMLFDFTRKYCGNLTEREKEKELAAAILQVGSDLKEANRQNIELYFDHLFSRYKVSEIVKRIREEKEVLTAIQTQDELNQIFIECKQRHYNNSKTPTPN